MNSPDPEPSPYLTSIFKNPPPPATRPQTVNLDLTLNPATSSYSSNSRLLGLSFRRSSFRMVRASELGTSDLINAVLTPSTMKPKREPKKFTIATVASSERPTPEQITPEKQIRSRKRTKPIQEQSSDPSTQSDADFTPHTKKHAVAAQQKKQKPSRSAYEDVIVTEGEDEDEDEIVATTAANRSSRHPTSNKASAARAKQNTAPQRTSMTPTSGALQKSRAVQNSNSKPDFLRRKVKSTPIPTTFDEAGEADRMMFRLRNEGHGWEEIRRKWIEITGVQVGESTLSVRFIKLNDNLSRNGGANDMRLIKYKKDVEAELQEELWTRVAEKIKSDTGHKYAPEVLRKRYAALERNGFDLSALENEADVANEEIFDHSMNYGDYDSSGRRLAVQESDEENSEEEEVRAALTTLDKKGKSKEQERGKRPPGHARKSLFGFEISRELSSEATLVNNTFAAPPSFATRGPLVGYESSDESDAGEQPGEDVTGEAEAEAKLEDDADYSMFL